MRSSAALAVIAVVALSGAACGGSEEPAATSTTAAGGTSEHDSHGDDPYGSHAMGVLDGDVSDIAALGPGPQVGESWEIPVGINICGQFVSTLGGGPVDGVTAVPGEMALVAPTTESEAGHGSTVGSYADAAGITLRTSEITLPATVVPATIQVQDATIPLAEQTFRTGFDCAGTPAEVQVWVYSAAAVASGEDIYTVIAEPERIPFVEEGMAVVVALAPESSLPTLPPAAILGR